MELEPRDLTLPESTETVRAVMSGALRRLAKDLARLRPRTAPDVARALDAARRAFLAELAREPGRAFAILRRPNVGAALRVLRERPDDGDVAIALACTLAVELAAAGAELEPIRFPRTPERVVCLGGRFVLPGGGPATLRARTWEHGGRVLSFEDADRDAFTVITEPIVLATVDDNPLAMVEAHPDKHGNAIDLGGRTVGEWVAPLRDALALVGEHLPRVREEMDIVLHQIIPVGADDQSHLSASYREAIGTIYLTLHPSAMTMTEAVIHEFSHNKLNAMLELDPLLENAFWPLYTSPVRPDPRPLHGVLLAVHAFLPVAELYRRMIAADDPRARSSAFHERYRKIVRGNAAGTAVLIENARPTRAGRALLDEIRRLDASFAADA
ncbi:MAG TPA: HEXXH motif-containing putative peptide modification protein [Sandaracinaceae bacterium]